MSIIACSAKPLIKKDAEGAKTLGTVLIGTVQGDLHDIGKNIVTFMLEINGYKVIDLGIDVPVAIFVESIKKHKPQVIVSKPRGNASVMGTPWNDFRMLPDDNVVLQTLREFTELKGFNAMRRLRQLWAHETKSFVETQISPTTPSATRGLT